MQASLTVLGRVRNALGYCLAVYCVFKMFASLKSVLFGEDFTTDPASRMLSIVLRIFSRGSLHLNAKAVSQYITILFVGFVSFNSLRTFLKHIRRIAVSIESLVGGGGLAAAALNTQQLGKSALSSNTDRMMLLLGAVLCAYTVSSAMLMRAQLPVGHRVLVTRALGFDDLAVDNEFDAVHR
jgi:golgi pH regulator